ncbi:DUF4153 domain-containing protein [Sphingomonas sp. OK281]|uniref:DUF4153 domain-containing protein n=1 Tax=Sphingomonas sp. OK281 TaxID=1881067 RepID=UPI0008EA8B4E|nr:DUF4173 domain-containing protein [Sphingomonas sp. OK281]SFO19739.1 protein of unknown function [Sphingomonas sp. OK281]
MNRNGRLAAKMGAVAALIVLAEILIDDGNGAVVGGFAGAWIATLYLTRRAIRHDRAARMATIAAAGMALVLVDDPSFLAWVLFWTALSLAALLPRHGFDDALAWSRRLGWHAISAVVAPVKDIARLSTIRQRRGARPGGIRAVARLVALPLAGGAVFLALFANANPLIGQAFAGIVLPDPWTIAWRMLFGLAVLIATWVSFRPSLHTTRWSRIGEHSTTKAFGPGVATLTLSLVTFNAIFAIETILDLVFLWSGAGLPAGVTMADYAHRGAYSLIVTALLAGVFVLVALRPGSAAAASPLVRRLVTVWMVQNLLLVASSALRTLDYVDAYGMTVLRLSALGWMALVASGLALIGWRLLAGKSAGWLINANAVAAMTVLATAGVVDLAATAAAWNVRTTMARGRAGAPLDLCYMARLGTSSLVSLTVLERHAREPGLHDRLAYLRWQTQYRTAGDQADWRRWTPRNARRLAVVRAMVGTKSPDVRPAPYGRDCDGGVQPPPPLVTTPVPLAPAPSTPALPPPEPTPGPATPVQPAPAPSAPKPLTPGPQR